MPGGTAAGNASSQSKYITAALADLFSCVGAGDIVSAKALLDGKHKNDKEVILSATNPAGITLLQHACHAGQAGGVKMLLNEGADPSWTSTKGSTPLHFACNNGHFDCAEALLTAGVDVDARNANGTTPLIIAAFGAHTSCVRLLLEHDADPNVRDNLGRRAGDSLCGAVTGPRGGAAAASARFGSNGAAGSATSAASGGGASGGGASGTGGGSSANPENQPFSETRSLLAVARAQRSSRRTRSDSGASVTSTTTSVHIKRLDITDGSRAGGTGGGMTLGGAVAGDGRGADVLRDGSDGAMPPSTVQTPPPTSASSCSSTGHPSASAKTASTSTSRTSSISRSSSDSSTSNSGRHACTRATQDTLPEHPTPSTAPSLVRQVATRPEQQATAGGGCVSGAASPLRAPSPMASPAPSRVPASRTATPMGSPASSPMTSPSRASKLSTPAAAAASSSSRSSSSTTSASPSSSAPAESAAVPVSATAETDPESQRSADLKAALAANAAMIRSIQEEEKVFSAQRDLLERRRGEAGERRKGAEEHAALLRACAGAMSQEDTSRPPLRITPVTTTTAVLPTVSSAAAASGSSTPSSRHGEDGSGSSSEQPPVFMLPSPVSKSNTNVSVFNISTRTTSNSGGCGSGGSDGGGPSTFSPVSAPPAGEPLASSAMAIANSSSLPTTWRRNRSIPPVPDFAMLSSDARDRDRRHASPTATGDDIGSAGVMEDEEDHHSDHNHHHGQHEEQQQGRQHCFSPGRAGVDGAPSSRSPFRAARGRLELRLQSPLRTLQRHGAGGGSMAGGNGRVSFGRTSSAGSVPDASNDREGAPDESNADMVEADSARGSVEATSLLVGTRSEAQERAGSGSDASTAEALEAQSRRVQELEAELRATRRDNRYRDGRSQRSRTNANKRQRAGTSFSSQHSRHSHQHHSDADGEGARGGFGGNKLCFSPRGGTHTSPSSSTSSSFSDLEPMSPALRNEVRRLRAESAARGREHASLAAQHASLVLEKARQAGVLRNRVASADEEVERLSRKLREAQEKLEAQAQEAEVLRRQTEEQQGLLHSRSHVLEQALGRLENIGVALAEERSLNSAARRNSRNTNPLSSSADGGGPSNRSSTSANTTDNSNSNGAEQPDDMASVDPETAPSMSVDGVSQADGDDNTGDHDEHNDDDDNVSYVAPLEDAPDHGGGSGTNGGNSGSDRMAVPSRENSAAAANVRDAEYEEDGTGGSVPMRDVEGEENEASEGAAPSQAPAAGNPAVAAAASETQETRPHSGHEMARIFSHQQIDAACAGFPDSAIVGRGGFGPVFRGRFMGEEVAVKRLDGYGLQGLPNFLREVQVLTTCRHEHLVPLLGICVDPTPMLVYPFVGQSLEWHLREPQRRAAISWSTRLSVALSVSKGLQYLHQPQAGAWGKPVIVHRDVKTENILMDANLRARLSDVGIARQLDRGGSEASTRLIGTWGYIDPEYQETGVLTPSSDVYSLGVVFLELLTGLPAHSAQLRPPSLVDRVIGKQLSDCLDPACTWPDTPPVVAFATEAWQCVSRKGDDRPRLQHLIERMERLDVEGRANDQAPGASASSSSSSSSDRDGNNTAAAGGHGASAFASQSAGASVSAILPQAASALGAAGGSGIAASPAAASSVAMAAAAAAATAARAATEAAAAATAVASGASALMLESPPASSASSSPSSSAASSPAMADAAAGAAVTPVMPVRQPQPASPPPGRDCMICASAPVQTRFLPCRHSLACGACASLLRARGDRCPVDRARIDDFETGQFQVTYTGARETG